MQQTVSQAMSCGIQPQGRTIRRCHIYNRIDSINEKEECYEKQKDFLLFPYTAQRFYDTSNAFPHGMRFPLYIMNLAILFH